MLWVFLLEDWYMNLRDLESGSDLHSKSADFECSRIAEEASLRSDLWISS